MMRKQLKSGYPLWRKKMQKFGTNSSLCFMLSAFYWRIPIEYKFGGKHRRPTSKAFPTIDALSHIHMKTRSTVKQLERKRCPGDVSNISYFRNKVMRLPAASPPHADVDGLWWGRRFMWRTRVRMEGWGWLSDENDEGMVSRWLLGGRLYAFEASMNLKKKTIPPFQDFFTQKKKNRRGWGS